MDGGNRKSDQDPSGSRGELVRLRPLRVLVVSPDRRFCAVTAMLTAMRGCAIFTAASTNHLAELIDRERIDVVVLDGDAEEAERSAASVSAEGFAPAAGVVAVAEEADEWSSGRVSLARWGPFEQLFAAINCADLRRGAFLETDGSTWRDPGPQHRERS